MRFSFVNDFTCEELWRYYDSKTGLNAMICIDNTSLGPACGGARMWPFHSEEEALTDVSRLARAMTYKSALAGLDFGGGKAVIIGDPNKDKTKELLRSYGGFVDSLRGKYITTEDVGIGVNDMVYVKEKTRFAVGLPESKGGLGDASVVTGYGIYRGIQACLKEVFGSDIVKGRTVAIQGFGKVALSVAHYLMKAGAKIIVSDIDQAKTAKAAQLGLSVVSTDDIYKIECDVFCPCALGGILNDDTIPKLQTSIVAGGANNQLLDTLHAQALKTIGILYAPDYAINPGGVISVSCEMNGYTLDEAMRKTDGVYATLTDIFQLSKKEDITTELAANRLAEKRLSKA